MRGSAFDFPFDAPRWAERFAFERLGMIGRHRHGGGPGGFGEDGMMPRGRKFSSDDLQLLLLAMLAETPRHGYELIKALEDRSNGTAPTRLAPV